MKSLAVGIVAVALLSGCARYQDAQHSNSAATSYTASPLSTGYVQFAGSADRFETEAAQVALQRATDPQVRNLAQGIATDHSQLGSQLAYATQRSGIITYGDSLSPEHATLLAQLENAGAADFDSSYRSIVVMSHMQELDAHQRYASSGDQPALRNFAQLAMSAVQARLNIAQSLAIAPNPSYRVPSHRRAGERG